MRHFTKQEINKLNKPFKITSVCRLDMVEVYTKQGVPETEANDKVLNYTNDEMEAIARQMADAYCETNGFWDSLEVLVEIFDKERKGDK